MTQPPHEDKRRTVLVVHPGIQHSNRVAEALANSQYLLGYHSGSYLVAVDQELAAIIPERFASRVRRVAIPRDKLSIYPWWQVLIKVASNVPSRRLRHDLTHLSLHLFDRWMARKIRHIKPDVVYGFENSTYYCFLAAKEIGAKCILDAPSLDHISAAAIIDPPTFGYLRRINTRKDSEVALADLIITCSEMARQGYIQHGVSSEKIRSVLLGSNSLALQRNTSRNEKLRFIFAGAMSERKSIDIILATFKRLEATSANAELHIYGGSDGTGWIEQCRLMSNVCYHGPVSQRTLAEAFSQGDCLLLPSRFDSFGMVVAEAMASGIPAVVSTRTGAKEIIARFPAAGWVIEASEEELYATLNKILASKDRLASAKAAAFEASKSFTWAEYNKRLIENIGAILR